MNPITAWRRWRATRPARYGSAEYLDLRERLDTLTRQEDTVAAMMRAGMTDPEKAVDQIMAIREEEVTVLRKLGWADVADEKEKDLTWRRESIAKSREGRGR